MNKDLAEQLRVIHLTVLVMCLILAASAFSQQRGPLKRAYEDAVNILNLSHSGDRFELIVQTDISPRLSYSHLFEQQLHSKIETEPFIDITLAGKVLYAIDRQSPYLVRPGGGTSTENLQPINNLRYWVHWDSLNEFIKTWDDSLLVLENPLKRSQFLNTVVAASNCGNSLRLIPVRTANTDVTLSAPTLSLEQTTKQASLMLAFSSTDPNLKAALDKNCRAFVPLGPIRGFEMNLRSSMQETVGAKWTPKPFKEAFVDLDDSSKYLRSLDLSDLAKHLQNESDKEGEKVEMFGAKIPFELVSSFGAVLLASCQFYLWCHLAEFKKRLKASTEKQEVTGYIGLYDITLARIFTLVSVSLVPVLTQAFTVWKISWDHFAWIAPAIGLVASSIFGGTLVVSYLRIWTVMDAPPHSTV